MSATALATEWDDAVEEEVRHLPALVPAGAMPALTTIELAPKAWKLAQRIASTPFAPKGLAGKPESVLAAMLVGNELGLPLMTSLAKVHVVDGRPGLAAETMRALVLSRGHDLWFEEKSNTSVTVCGKRAGANREQKVTWTIDDARAAKLLGKDNWQKYPRGMLAARSTSELCRDLFPDVIGGLYSVEEIADGFDFEQLLDDEPAAPAAPATRRVSSPAAKKRAASRARVAAGEGPEPAPPPIPEDDIEDAVIVDEDTPPPPPIPEEDEPDLQHVGETVAGAVKDLQERTERASKAQRIAIQARELDLDRAHVISAVTAGAKTSGKELDDAEADLVLDALRRLKVGEVRLEFVDGIPELHDAPEVPNEEPVQGALLDDEEPVEAEIVEPTAAGDDSEGWDGQDWRAHIKASAGTLVKTLTQAAHIAHELDVAAPPDATALSEADPELRHRVLVWLTLPEGA